MNTRTLYLWKSDPAGGESGRLTLWPGKKRELTLELPHYRTAHALAERVVAAEQDAYRHGRESLKREVERIVP